MELMGSSWLVLLLLKQRIEDENAFKNSSALLSNLTGSRVGVSNVWLVDPVCWATSGLKMLGA